jgi:hypothetical protein
MKLKKQNKSIPFYMTTIVLPCEAGKMCVQNPVPGKLKKVVN